MAFPMHVQQLPAKEGEDENFMLEIIGCHAGQVGKSFRMSSGRFGK
jgi:hypothetical protein